MGERRRGSGSETSVNGRKRAWGSGDSTPSKERREG